MFIMMMMMIIIIIIIEEEKYSTAILGTSLTIQKVLQSET